MLEEESAIISENQDNRAHFLAGFIISHSEDIDFEDDSDVEKTESK